MILFKNKKVVVMGLGLHGGGVGVAKFFCQQRAKVLVTDLKTKNQLKESVQKLKGLPIKYVLGKHRKEDFIQADLIIKNPDVANDSLYIKIARENNIPVETDINLFFELSDTYIIGITGTKGKSTIATLIYKFLKSKYPKTILAGNIGISPLELLPKIRKGAKVVLELSSFELEDLKKSPQMAVITNIFTDHLNRYKSLKDYIEAKKAIFKYQKKNDILVLNYDDPIVRRFFSSVSSQVYFFSKSKKKDIFLKKENIYFKGKSVCSIKNFKLYGEHNLSNLLAAVSAAKLLKVPSRNIEKVIKSFRTVPYRQEFIGEKKGVKYFNDTTATIPQAVKEAVKTMRKRFPKSQIILIAGGQDKKLDFNVLSEKPNYLILLPGTASKKIKEKMKVRTFIVDSMRAAVQKASKISQKGDIVLLSPGAASFNLFKNEFDRGEQFNKIVKSLKK